MISHRRLFTLAAATLTAAALLGCAPTPDPTPEPLFATEAEAYAAAEQVYREYLAAPSALTSEPEEHSSLDYLTGTALTEELDGVELIKESGVHLEGSAKLVSFSGISFDGVQVPVQVDVVACRDLTDLRVVDESGADVTPPTRPSLLASEVTFTEVNGRLLISKLARTESSRC